MLNKSVLVIENNFIYNNIECKANTLKPLTSYNSVKIKYSDVFLYYFLNDKQYCLKNNIAEGLNKNSLRNIFEFLNEFDNLSSLEIYFDTNKRPTPLACWYETTHLREQRFKKLHSLKILKIRLSGVEVFCYLQLFLDLMPELVHIDLTLTSSGEQICFDETRIKLFKYLNEGKNRIKTLKLSVDSETETLISTIEGMNLETMSFGQFVNFTDPNKLLHLAMPIDHHSNLDVVCDLYPNLETISVKLCYNQGILAGLRGLKKLRNLKVCNFGDEFIDDLAEYDSNVLRNLYLIQYHWEYTDSFVSLKNLTNLTHLSCDSIKLTDKEMQEISKNLINLQHMALEGHFVYNMKLTDFGFTGETESKATFLKHVNPFFKKRNKKIQTGYSISNLKHLKLLHLHISKSSLGDATLTHIMRIKGLEYLYITCCYDRVEVSIECETCKYLTKLIYFLYRIGNLRLLSLRKTVHFYLDEQKLDVSLMIHTNMNQCQELKIVTIFSRLLIASMIL